MDERIRVVIAKPGLDGHDRGAKIVARALRDAGMEVVYTGLHQTPEQIVETVVQEDADAVGLSVLSGAHMTLFARLAELMGERGIDDVVVFGGGIIPDEDIPELERLGVAHIFTPGATTTEIVDWVREHVGAAAGLTPVSRRPAPSAAGTHGPRSGGEGDRLRRRRAPVGHVAAGEDHHEPVPGREAVHDARQLDGHRLGDVGDADRRDQPVRQLDRAVRADVVELREDHQLAGGTGRLRRAPPRGGRAARSAGASRRRPSAWSAGVVANRIAVPGRIGDRLALVRAPDVSV